MSDSAAPTAKKKGLLGNVLGGGKTYFVAAGVASVMAMGGVLGILGTATQTQTYYVLGQDVPARAQITEAMLLPLETKIGAAPGYALNPAYVRDNPVFSKVPLKAGEVVTTSTAGPLERITADIPATFVAASFQVSPENAVAGKVRKGDYIDLIAVGDGDNALARIALQHVLVLDVAVSPQTISDSANAGQAGADLDPGPESNAVRGGIPQMYTVALSPKDATKLAIIRTSAIMVVLSPNTVQASVDVSSGRADVYNAPATDSGAGTSGAAAAVKGADGTATKDAPPAGTPVAPTTSAPATPATEKPTN